MQDNEIAVASISKRTPWNKGKIYRRTGNLRAVQLLLRADKTLCPHDHGHAWAAAPQ